MRSTTSIAAALTLSLLACPVWPQSGSRIAFVSKRDGNEEIYVMDEDGSGQMNVTNAPGSDTTPCWSPDGSKIAFASSREGSYDIFLMDADGSNVVRLTDSPWVDADPTWSPDGSKIAFASKQGGTYSIYYLDLEERETYQLTDDSAHDISPAWSPDGQTIAFSSDRRLHGTVLVLTERNMTFAAQPPKLNWYGLEMTQADIYVMDLDGTDLTNLTGHTRLRPSNSPSWSPDGGTLLFSSYEVWAEAYGWLRNPGLYRVDMGHSVAYLGRNGTNNQHSPSWSPDGSRVAYSSSPGDMVHDASIYAMAAEGGDPVRLTDSRVIGLGDFQPDWSPLPGGTTHVAPASWGQVKRVHR